MQEADLALGAWRLRARRNWQGDRCAVTNEELASLYSIHSLARASMGGGTVIPSDLATLTLTTSSNLVDCSTGRSAGFAPFRMLSTKVAARWRRKTPLGP